MNNDQNDLKKGFPGGFVWFLVAAFFLTLMVQSHINTKFANVAFSYELEHLVNLQMIEPDQSRKIALNDNLVTFSGKFREKLTDEGKTRYKYLELLSVNHKLNVQKELLDKEIEKQADKIKNSAELFLTLTGQALPAGGYVVVDDFSNAFGNKDLSIIITKKLDKKLFTLPDLKSALLTVKADPSQKNIQDFQAGALKLIRQFRSANLGVGSESMKKVLRNLETDLENATLKNLGATARLDLYQSSVNKLDQVVADLSQKNGNLRLQQLRSVRDYNEKLAELGALNVQFEENQAKLDKARQSVSSVIWYYNNEELSTRSLEKQDPEKFNQWFSKANQEWQNFERNKTGVFKAPDQPLNTVLEKSFKSEEPAPNYLSYLFTFMPVLIVIAVLYFIFSRQMKGAGGGAMGFGKSPARLMTKEKNKVTFKDVAGVDEALEELQEIVEFLKNPQKFTALGGHIPKGVLCVGAPGTGKTLIAKAVAGEADRPFFSISGSDFVEMFVGVGASRIRDMFVQAKKHAPCIIFIDEIDAVGRHRGAGMGGGHDEREQTLNQLLVEMDGFDTGDGVILIAATNRPDVLDKALMRPGRFDRHVMINLPDIKGRYEILKVHAKKIKMDESVDLMTVARATPGSSGADLENILNEAALIAARKERTAVTGQDVTEARDKVLFGKERRSMEMDESEKLTTAYHESGHTVVGLAVKHSDPVEKVTIIPRGMSLGSTMFLPEKNKTSYWKKEIVDRLAVLMGGRVAEEVFVDDMSSGAQQDIEQATKLARAMVCEWGMSDELGVMTYDERSDKNQYLGGGVFQEKKYSEETAKTIDAEVRRILQEGHAYAVKIINEKKEVIELMTQMLMEFETLDKEDIQDIYNGTWDLEKKKARLKAAEESHKKQMQTTKTTVIEPGPSPDTPIQELRPDIRA